MTNAIVWLRRDFRLKDNPAILNALLNHKNVILLYIHNPKEQAPWEPGEASNWYLSQTLKKFNESVNFKLHIVNGNTDEMLEYFCKKYKCFDIYYNRIYEPAFIKQEDVVNEKISSFVNINKYHSGLLFNPYLVAPSSKEGYRVFGPYWKSQSKTLTYNKIPVINNLDKLIKINDDKLITVDNLNYDFKWAEKFNDFWLPGEDGAHEDLEMFIESHAETYFETRNTPNLNQTSLMSAALHFGEITAKQIYNRLHEEQIKGNLKQSAIDAYLRQLAWREFAYHILVHNPETISKPFNKKYKNFLWIKNDQHLEKWKKGETGFEMVDAGMKQLWHTGWMHNRVRMITSSFLCKNLGISWLTGANYFWDTLVDANLANNIMGWQWCSGIGADAAPYFRILSPKSQQERFDPEKKYIKKWVKVNYPEMIDIKKSREDALNRNRKKR